MNKFESTLHNVYTEMKNKVTLSHHDDNRYPISNTTKTLPLGHSDTVFNQPDPEVKVQLCLKTIEAIQRSFDECENELVATTSDRKHLSSENKDDQLGILISLKLKDLKKWYKLGNSNLVRSS